MRNKEKRIMGYYNKKKQRKMGKKKNRENSLKLKQYRNENFLLFIYIFAKC